MTSSDVTDGETSQNEGPVDEFGESIKSETGETLKDILDKSKDKKEVGTEKGIARISLYTVQSP